MRAKSSKQRCPALCLYDLSYNVKYHWSCRVGGCYSHLTASGSWQGFPGVDHEGHQDSAVLISVVTQRGILVVGIVYGCPYFKDPATFSLVSKYHKWKNRLFPTKASASVQANKFGQLGQDVCSAGNTFEKIAEGCRWELKARNSAVQLCAYMVFCLLLFFLFFWDNDLIQNPMIFCDLV